VRKRYFALTGLFIGALAIFVGVLNSTLKEDTYTIAVSEEILRSYYLKNRNFEQPFFTEFEELSETQILSIRKDFIRKEVLKREAKSLGLDEVDTIIANRLAQLGELALVGADLREEDISEDELFSFYKKNKKSYIERATISLTHIFFRENSSDILRYRDLFNDEQKSISSDVEIGQIGNVFPYQKNYSRKNYSFILGHFGKKGTDQIFSLPSNTDKWQGPIESSLGYHLVKIYGYSPERQLDFEEVYSEVRKDFIESETKKRKSTELEKKISEYKVIER
jgi:hypothetical protein